MYKKYLKLLIFALLFLIFFWFVYRPYRVKLMCEQDAQINWASNIPAQHKTDEAEIRKSGMNKFDYYRNIYINDCLTKFGVK